MIGAEKITILNNDWITFVFLIILSILTIEKFLFENRLLKTSSFFFKKKNMLSYFNKEKNIFFNLYQILFFIVQLLTIALLLYYLNGFLGLKIGFTGLKLYIAIAIGVSLYFALRLLTGIVLAFIFDIKSVHQKISFQKISYFNNLFYFILYLCALEIVPIVIILKLTI